MKCLKKALAGCDAAIAVDIWALLSANGRTFYGGASQDQIMSIAQQLSQVSGGSGLDLIALALSSDTQIDSQAVEDLTRQVRWRLDRYTPGTEYPLSLEVPENG
ncbi:MAG: hypothetical protein ACRC62_23495 [Microcoleus sp.]